MKNQVQNKVDDKVNDEKAPHSIHPSPIRGGVNWLVFILTIFCVSSISFVIGTRLGGWTVSTLNYNILTEAYNALVSKYDGKVDDGALLQGAIKGMVAATGDEYTEYLTANEYSRISDDLAGEIEGIGVQVGYNADGQIQILSVLKNTPANKSGLKAGDVIVKVNNKAVGNQSLSMVVGQIRGKAGTHVNLNIERAGKLLDFKVKRTKIDNPSVSWRVIDDNIGYISISAFGEDTVELATRAAKDLRSRHVKGIVLDLRGNTGGYVDAAKGVASLWLKQGAVITEERSSSRVISVVRSTGENILGDIPTTVLINETTASASEIVAGALHDNKDAKLVGANSYGKGLVQEIVDLSDNAKLKVTIAKWYTPKGVNINKAGLKPNNPVNMTLEQYRNGDDVQLKAAVDLLKK